MSRILHKLKERGVVKEPVSKPHIGQKKAKATSLCGKERAQRTHTEEFYEVTDASFELSQLNQALLKWERVYNTIRPHQALGYLTPQGVS